MQIDTRPRPPGRPPERPARRAITPAVWALRIAAGLGTFAGLGFASCLVIPGRYGPMEFTVLEGLAGLAVLAGLVAPVLAAVQARA